ncbi:hypothetical protein F4781DRAFT_339249 [Annulohypoxylon bovei var. microspora]|nr:hypothetical protein F4781DRAFT_339249 [Annulohypoxylon bovei var. microspora]
MHAKSVIVALLGVTAIAEATAISRPYDQIMNRRAVRALNTRQFGKGQGQAQNSQKANAGNNNNNANANAGNNANANAGNNANANANAGNNNAQNGNNNAAQASLTLDANAVQTGSQSDGDPDAAEGEAASDTDNANFINFCSGQTLTNGLQQKQGSCNGIVMGKIPAQANMVSSVLQNPQHNDNLQANQDFDIQVQVANFQAGTFTNADNTYYSAPQNLNGQGNIIGHTHVTVQDLGNSLNPTQPLDATQFVFFKGINDAGNGNGLLSATVTGGLPAGNYRVCTMFSSANHQPVLMPVAQRGAQDDCNKFTAETPTLTLETTRTPATPMVVLRRPQVRGKMAKAKTKNLGGAAPAVTKSGDASRPFAVNGNTFVNQAAATQRSCDIQNNACSDAANAGASFKLSDCQAQQQACIAAA